MHPHLKPFGMIPMGSLPVGAVTAFAGAGSVEAWGWMLCDGRSLSVPLYPELFAVLGYLYGGKDGNFNIPDYRGTFQRGVDDGAGIDPDVSLRTSPAGGTDPDQGVGSRQDSAMLIHDHNYQAVPASVTPSGQGSAASGSPSAIQTSTPADTKGTLLTTTTGISDYETRPRNTAVNYLIKFTYGPWRHAGEDVWPH